VLNPKTGGLILELPEASEAHINSAVAAAEAAFTSWSRTTPSQRSNYLLKSLTPSNATPKSSPAGSAQLRQADQCRSQ
jgi:delta 1-pyrroline-5-carboxylate dehydrogenase